MGDGEASKRYSLDEMKGKLLSGLVELGQEELKRLEA
jgi:hypothetical protein